jgi:hypothetical protein
MHVQGNVGMKKSKTTLFNLANCIFNSQQQQKNVNKNCMKIFSLAKNLFNIVMGILFPYLLTHLHIKPRLKRGFLFALF